MMTVFSILTFLIFGMMAVSPYVYGLDNQDGIASFYSTETCINAACLTASGKSLHHLESENKLFAASWHFPIGTKLKVTNMDNLKSVVVTVEDRGPNKRYPERVIDLCQLAFNKIADLDKGLIPVKVERILS